MKISGATLNQPIPPPPACIAKKSCIFAKIIHRTTSLLTHFRTARPRTAAHAYWLSGLSFHDGVLLDSGRIVNSGLDPGSFREGHGFRSRPEARKNVTLPKSNRMTHPPLVSR